MTGQSPPSPQNHNNSNGGIGPGESFESFFEGWRTRQNQYLEQLVFVQENCGQIPDRDVQVLVSRVLSHYQQYYSTKSIAAHENVHTLFAPPWFTPFERTFLWIAGFKPGLMFRIVNNSVSDMSQEQSRQLSRLRLEIRAVEKELSDEMARVQEGVVGGQLVELASRTARLVDGEADELGEALEALRAGMEVLLENADFLRMTTARAVVEILTPNQAVRVLAAAAELFRRIRAWGLQLDMARRGGGRSPPLRP
ncbi:hypothetical protein GIB67_014362 [Kingdonia uniflora]|uniref:DOG1 domain-containing protein n=1 Tax=Kingdonia uniflora TaxID=39325 RepID=A0A7J7NTX2_9MAGN|nr:hypothetical protein GIB67_014362 [Kingdonia uniflora]